jgi:hypothetical protein
VLKAPTSLQYKRFVDQIGIATKKDNPKARAEAQDLLARSCWVYPSDSAAQAAMLEEFPGLLLSITLRATKLVEATEAAEGKG